MKYNSSGNTPTVLHAFNVLGLFILISLFKKSQLSIVINLNFLVSLSCSNC